jgi:hypothetical protein
MTKHKLRLAAGAAAYRVIEGIYKGKKKITDVNGKRS